MKRLAIACVATAVVMLGLDSIWLTLTATPLYRARLGDLLLPHFILAPAVAFYALYVFGLVVLVELPALAARSARHATIRGALFGLVAYATYDLTNQASLRGWPVTVTLADLGWGTVLSALAASAGFLAASRFAPD